MRRLLVLPALAIALMLACRGPAISPLSTTETGELKKPLIGAMALDFHLDNPIWRGPLSGDIDGWIEFTSLDGYANGKSWHFAESWEIKASEDGPVLLAGTDEGVVSPNSDYVMNGVVTFATGDWVFLLGRNVHASGYITWHPEIPDLPVTAPGTFRIN